MTTAERLLEVRKRLGKTQRELADLMEIDVNTYSLYERGLRLPKAEALAKLIEHGVDIAWLLTGIEMKSPGGIHAMFGELERQGAIRPGAVPPPPLREETLAACIQSVEEHLAARGAALPPDKKAAVVAALYALAIKTDTSMGNDIVGTLVRLAS